MAVVKKSVKPRVKKTWDKSQNAPQSKVYKSSKDSSREAKPVGWRWTDAGAMRLGKNPSRKPNAADIAKYKDATFIKKGETLRYLYEEKRADKSDVEPKEKLASGGKVKQNAPQSTNYSKKRDAAREAKPVGWRWTNAGALRLGKRPNGKPSEADIAKYKDLTFIKFGEKQRYLYEEKRKDKSDKEPKEKFAHGGAVQPKYEIQLNIAGLHGEDRVIGKFIVTEDLLEKIEAQKDYSVDVIDDSDGEPNTLNEILIKVNEKAHKLGLSKFEYGGELPYSGSNLRSVKVHFANGDAITTNMASHLTDDEIRNYYKVGKLFNIGSVEDNMQAVTQVDILKEEGGNIEENVRKPYRVIFEEDGEEVIAYFDELDEAYTKFNELKDASVDAILEAEINSDNEFEYEYETIDEFYSFKTGGSVEEQLWSEKQNAPQSQNYNPERDALEEAKPAGWRWTSYGAKKLGLKSNAKPTKAEVEQYKGKTFRLKGENVRYLYNEKRADKSDVSKKHKLASGGLTQGQNFKRVLNLGKIDYYGTGRKVNAVDIQVELRYKKDAINYETLHKQDGYELSMSGNVWNPRHSDIVAGGQMLDEIAEFYPKNHELLALISIWEKYHNNDMKAGTKAQTQAIENWELDGNRYDYDKVVNYLKQIDLYEDNGYKYGHGWLFMPIPENVINEIVELCNAIGSQKFEEGGELAIEEPKYTNEFKEVYSDDQQKYFVRAFGELDVDGDNIETYVVASIRDVSTYLSEDEYEPDERFEIHMAIVPEEKYLSEEVINILSLPSDSPIDNKLVQVAEFFYSEALVYNPLGSVHSFDSFESAVDFLKSEELNDKIDLDSMIVDSLFNHEVLTKDYMVNSKSAFEKGGVAKAKKGLKANQSYVVNYVHVDVNEDDYEEGEGASVNSYSMPEFKHHKVKNIMDFLSGSLYFSKDPNDYTILDGTIRYSELQDRDGSKATESQIEAWKECKIKLYNANYDISISVVTEKKLSDEELSAATGIGVYKVGGITQHGVQSENYSEERDAEFLAKPTGYRFTNKLAKRLGYAPNKRPTIEEIEKYKGKGVYYEVRYDKSDKNQKKKLATGGTIDDARIENILRHYVAAALWSTSNPDEEDEMLDANYSFEDVDERTLDAMRSDIRKFLSENEDAIIESEMTDEQLGHDLWLTRNGHGAGFFDRGYDKEVEDKLMDAARAMKSVDLEIGDDNKVHQMGVYEHGGMFAKGGSTSDVYASIKSDNVITEKQLKLIQKRLNSGKADEATVEIVDYIWDNTPRLTSEQNEKGIAFLMNLWKTPTGKERSNNPFGMREQDVLETFEYLELAGYHDISRYAAAKYFIPIYNVIGKDGSFQYHMSGGKVNIIGAKGLVVSDNKPKVGWRYNNNFADTRHLNRHKVLAKHDERHEHGGISYPVSDERKPVIESGFIVNTKDTEEEAKKYVSDKPDLYYEKMGEQWAIKKFEHGGSLAIETDEYKVGGAVKIPNAEAKAYSENRIPFLGSNLKGETLENGDYVVFSYGHYPIWFWSLATRKWYGNGTKYSKSTSAHTTLSRPTYNAEIVTKDELTDIMMKSSLGKLYDDDKLSS